MARVKPKPGARHSALAARIVERWGDAGGDISLDRLASELGDSPRYDIVAALKELERAGSGEFSVGNAGRKARFLWSAGTSSEGSAKSANKAATKQTASSRRAEAVPRKAAQSHVTRTRGRGEASTAKAAHTSIEAPAKRQVSAPKPDVVKQPVHVSHAPAKTLDHVFHLRPGYLVTVHLPADVTRAEVDRFCGFLKVIPFDGHNES